MVIKANGGPTPSTGHRAARGHPQCRRDQAHLATRTMKTRDTALGHTIHPTPMIPAMTAIATRRHDLRHQDRVGRATRITKTRDTVQNHMTELQRMFPATFTPIPATRRHPLCEVHGVDQPLLQIGIRTCRLVIPTASVTLTTPCTQPRLGTRRRECHSLLSLASIRPDPAWALVDPASLGRGIIFPSGR
jgi:hypothetical protein